ncbi:hypothetical protein JCGZ_21310 [Jatropha curcas]|uniref:MORF/ORRM1/DAG-like MORF domain-containing protein n=1 Tax=Jatropha curcas TaxID=180498 RepID=A0A067JMV1_JATCU|nr:hypothetical protein JCGZ_21310 [Jatropha curcas]
MATFTFSCFTLSSYLKPSISPFLASTSQSWGRLQRIAVNTRVQPRSLMIRAAVDSDYSKYWAKSNSSSSSSSGGTEEIITLPGCDYNHWLIVMEFPKDPEPTRQQMIDIYLDTLASVLGSMEEAKKNMYAFSTTTYTGFQCTVDEATAEKFKGLPGVLWVLPDSHLDVKNKDYGGDKYINGKIIPCTYPTHRSKQRNSLKYETRRHDRRRDGPSPDWRSPRQGASST